MYACMVRTEVCWTSNYDLAADVCPCLDAGAIEAVDGSNLIILNSTFSRNIGQNAGAIALRNSSLLVNGSTFEYNRGPQVGSSYSF